MLEMFEIIKTACLYILVDFVSEAGGCAWLCIHHRKGQKFEMKVNTQERFPGYIDRKIKTSFSLP